VHCLFKSRGLRTMVVIWAKAQDMVPHMWDLCSPLSTSPQQATPLHLSLHLPRMPPPSQPTSTHPDSIAAIVGLFSRKPSPTQIRHLPSDANPFLCVVLLDCRATCERSHLCPTPDYPPRTQTVPSKMSATPLPDPYICP